MQLVKTSAGRWKAQFDHAVPIANGGQDNADNIQALTVECHKAKTAEVSADTARETQP